MIRKLLCRILGHDWHAMTDGIRSVGTCQRCGLYDTNRPEWEGKW